MTRTASSHGKTLLMVLARDSCHDLGVDVDEALVRFSALDVLRDGHGDRLVEFPALIVEGRGGVAVVGEEGRGERVFLRSRSGGCQTLGLPPLWEPSLLPRFYIGSGLVT